MAHPTFIIPTPRSRWSEATVYGLGDPVEEARVLDRPLSAWRRADRALLLTEGGREGDRAIDGPALLVGEDLWLSEAMAGAFLAAVGQRETIVRLGRALDGPGRFADPLHRLPRSADGRQVLFDLWAVPAGVSVRLPPAPGALPASLEDAATADVTCRTRAIEMPIDPEMTGAEALELSFGAATCAPVGHWVELLRANLLAIAARVLSVGVARSVLSLLWAALRALSLNPFEVLGKVTRRGRRCRVHPTAVVEGCHLGDDVKVDAGAILRGCVVGDGAEIGAQAIAEFSVIGAGAKLQRRAMANLSVLYPGARAGGILQIGLMGRGAVSKMFAVGTDMRLGKAVAVKTPDGLLEVDTGYQGVCLGHGAFVGSGVWIAPGRVIEGGRQVVREASLMVLK